MKIQLQRHGEWQKIKLERPAMVRASGMAARFGLEWKEPGEVAGALARFTTALAEGFLELGKGEGWRVSNLTGVVDDYTLTKSRLESRLGLGMPAGELHAEMEALAELLPLDGRVCLSGAHAGALLKLSALRRLLNHKGEPSWRAVVRAALSGRLDVRLSAKGCRAAGVNPAAPTAWLAAA